MGGVQRALAEALNRFITNALELRDRLTEDDGHSFSTREFARELAGLKSVEEVNSAAREAAKANAYLIRKKRTGGGPRKAGRELTAKALLDTGVAGILAAGAVTKSALVKELTGYLSGPAIPVWDYAIIDADLRLQEVVEVVDGWELVTPSAAELSALMGVPSGASHQPSPPFPLELYSGLAMLRRIDPDATAVTGWLINFDFRPTHTLWLPLIALSLYQNPVLQLWAKYKVEPGRRVSTLFDRVYIEPWTPDGVTEIERVRLGDFGLDETQEGEFRRFLEKVGPLLTAISTVPERAKKPLRERAERLRRVAEHFLTAGEDAHGEGEVLSEFNADAVLHYVIALEAVLTGDGSEKTELTRKVVQRAAIIAGVNDEDRAAVSDIVRAAYGARSAYAHGSEPKKIDLPQLRRVVRDCVLAFLILEGQQGGKDLGELADAALLDHSRLRNEIRRPIEDFWQTVHISETRGRTPTARSI